MNKILLILSGGKGVRFEESLPKQYYKDYNGNTILKKSVLPFKKINFNKIIIVCHEKYQELILEQLSFIKKSIIFAKEGKTRMHSIVNGLNKIENKKNSQIFIQESVRPYVSEKIINDLLKASKEFVAVSPSITPSVLFGKLNSKNKLSNKLYKKDNIVEFQLPKRYNLEILWDCIKSSSIKLESSIDESEYIIEAGYSIHLVQGSYENLKITFPFHKGNIKIN